MEKDNNKPYAILICIWLTLLVTMYRTLEIYKLEKKQLQELKQINLHLQSK